MTTICVLEFHCSVPSPVLGIVCFFHFSHSHRYVMAFHCGFIYETWEFFNYKIRDVFPWTTALNRELENFGKEEIQWFYLLLCGAILLRCCRNTLNFEASPKFMPLLLFCSFYPTFTSVVASSNSGNKNESDRNS